MSIPIAFFTRLGGAPGIATQEPYDYLGVFLTHQATRSVSGWLNEFVVLLENWNPDTSTFRGSGELLNIEVRGQEVYISGIEEYLPGCESTVSIADFIHVAKQWKAKLIECQR